MDNERSLRRSCDLPGLSWWRGRDLNLRPLGYEPWSSHIDQCRLVSFRAIYQDFLGLLVSIGIVRFRAL